MGIIDGRVLIGDFNSRIQQYDTCYDFKDFQVFDQFKSSIIYQEVHNCQGYRMAFDLTITLVILNEIEIYGKLEHDPSLFNYFTFFIYLKKILKISFFLFFETFLQILH